MWNDEISGAAAAAVSKNKMLSKDVWDVACYAMQTLCIPVMFSLLCTILGVI